MKHGFVRDVVVNVIANLVAAAIIYLLGTLAGLFPRSPAAIQLSIIVILLASFLAMTAAAVAAHRRIMGGSHHWSTYVAAIAAIPGGISTVAGYWTIWPGSTFEQVLGTVMGVGIVGLGCELLIRLRNRKAYRGANTLRSS